MQIYNLQKLIRDHALAHKHFDAAKTALTEARQNGDGVGFTKAQRERVEAELALVNFLPQGQLIT